MDSPQRNFHLEEYKSLKGEVKDQYERIQKLLQYSVIVTATVYAWLATQGIGHNNSSFCLELPNQILSMAWWIPLAFSVFSGIAALILFLRLGQMSEYLRKLETKLGEEKFGWDIYSKEKPSVVTMLGVILWIVLIVGNGLIVFKITRIIEGIEKVCAG